MENYQVGLNLYWKSLSGLVFMDPPPYFSKPLSQWSPLELLDCFSKMNIDMTSCDTSRLSDNSPTLSPAQFAELDLLDQVKIRLLIENHNHAACAGADANRIADLRSSFEQTRTCFARCLVQQDCSVHGHERE